MTWPAEAILTPILRKISLLLLGVASLAALPVSAELTVPLMWEPSVDPNVAGYRIYYGVTSRNYVTSVDVGNVTSASVSIPAYNTTYYFAATTYDVSGNESDYSDEATYELASQPPTLAPLNNLTISENAGLQTVNLSGISLGSGTTVTITASSSNPGLIPNPAVNYVSPNSAGSLAFAPAQNASGTAVITVTANNGESQSNLVSQSFTVTVKPVYQPPTLAPLNNLTISENSGVQTVNLSGLGLGSGATLIITATSSNPGLIPNPVVKYTSPSGTGGLTFAPVQNASGTAVITVTANNGEAQNNLVTQTFTVTVNHVYQRPTLAPLNNLVINENAGLQTVNLSGISLGSGTRLTLTANSSNPSLIPTPVVNYVSPSTTGSLTFTPAQNTSGTAVITVTADNGESQSNLVTQTFTVTVNHIYLPPAMSPLGDLSVDENSGIQTVNLSGIGLGSGTALAITASSSNPSLIPNPAVNYSSPASTGSLTFTPVQNLFGTAVITVTANNGESQSNLVTQTFTVTVKPVYQPPTLAPLNNLAINEDAGAQTVLLSGIGLGSGTRLTITASSSNPALIPDPMVNYTSPASTGSLTFTPAPNSSGTAVITVIANNGESQSNLVTQTFTVTVNHVYQPPTLAALNNLTINENSGLQTVNLSGIGLGSGTAVTITASSSNPTLIPAPVVNYASPASTGSLTFTPALNASGTTIITVTANNGESQSNLVTQTFTVTVNHVYQFPTLAPLNNLTINENTGLQTVNLSGIGPGSGAAVTITASSSNPSLIPTPAVNYASPASTGSLTFKPTPNVSGTAVITVTANNGESQSNLVTQTFIVTVNHVYQPPTLAVLNNLSISENAGVQTVNLAGISLGSGTALSIAASSSNPALIPNPAVIYVSPDNTGSLTFTPAQNVSGTAVITVTANNGESQSNLVTQTFIVTVNHVYQLPTLASVDNLSIGENSGVQTVNLSGISLGSGTALTITASSSNPSLIATPAVNYVSPASTGSLTFKPAPNVSGTAVITVTANNGESQSNLVTQSFTVTVNHLYQPPTLASVNNLAINENAGQQTVNFSGISPGSGTALTITASSSNPSLIPNPSVNYVSPNNAGSLTFTPVQNVSGSATITVTVNNGEAQSNLVTQTFIVTVIPGYQSPTLGALSNVAINENAGQQTVNLSGISLGSGTTLSITASSSNPALIPNPTVNYVGPNSAGSLTFTPAPDSTGTAVITVTANNGESQSNLVSQTFVVTVNHVYQLPTLSPLNNLTLNENAGQQTVNLSGISLGSGTTLNVTASSSNPSLIPAPVVNYASPSSTGNLTFKPAQNSSGTAVITVTANNGESQSNVVTQTFIVTVNHVYQSPTLSPLNNLTINENAGQQTVNLSGISLGSGTTLSITASSSNPALIPNPTVNYVGPNSAGSLTFTPAPDSTGTAVITVTANNGESQSNLVSQTFVVTVNHVYQLPTLSPLNNLTLNENAGQQTVNLSGISLGSGTTLNVTASSSNPSLIPAPVVNYASPSSTGNLTFKPAQNSSGTAVITVTANNGESQSNVVTQTFIVTVNHVYQSPTLSPLNNLTLNENSGQQTVNLSGISLGSGTTLSITANSSNPSLIPNPAVNYVSPNSAGSLTFTPAPDSTGTAVITVTANNGESQSNLVTQSFVVTVNHVYQSPTLSPLADLAINQNSGQQTVNLAAIGLGSGTTLTITASSSNPALIPAPAVHYVSPSATGSLTFTPAPNASGSAVITVTANNGESQSNLVSRTFTVTVNPVSTVPALAALNNLTIFENAGAQTVNLSGISLGSGTALTITASSSNPSLIPNPAVNYVSPASTGSLTFAPAQDASGTAVITVTANNGQAQNNLATQTFTVTVKSVSQTPSLAPLDNLAVIENTGEQTVTLSGISPGSGTNLTITASSRNPSLIPTTQVHYVSPASTGSLTFTPAPNLTGTALITVTANNGQPQNNLVSQTFAVTVYPGYQPPTLAPLNNLTINQNSGLQTVSLSGISPGSGTALTIAAVSSNPALIPNPAVNYASPASAGSLTFTPAPNSSGMAVITVTANNGQSQSNLVTQTFTVTVNPVTPLPTLAPLNNLTIGVSAGAQTVNLSGISLGSGNKLTITANSSNPALIPNPVVNYISPASTGSLTFTPVQNASGSAVITVTANNGQSQSNLVTQTFTVTVKPADQPPTLAPLDNLTIVKNTGLQTVNLSGISPGSGSSLTLTASSRNPSLIPTTQVQYVSPASTGSLTFTLAPNMTGTALITVTANNGQAQNNLVSQTFSVTVIDSSPTPTLGALSDFSINENAGQQTVNLSGISLGSGNTLSISASSSNPSLIPTPVVNYSSPASTGSLTFAPAQNMTGTAVITVTANNGQSQSNLVTQSFTVTVNPVYLTPTLAALNDLFVNENAGQQTVNLSGISPGSGSAVTITASSSNPSVIPNPVVNYVSPGSTGSLTFTPVPDVTGKATITVTANNGQSQSNLVTRTFIVTVSQVYQPPTLAPLSNLAIVQDAGTQTANLSTSGSGSGSGVQTVNLSGISLGSGSTLTITARSSNPSLIPDPAVNYTSPSATGSLTIVPTPGPSGTAIITVTADNHLPQNNLVTQTFIVTVLPNQSPTLNPINDLTMDFASAAQGVTLSGIGPGANGSFQKLKITATSDNSKVVSNPRISYVNSDTTATLSIQPSANASGTAVITVTVNDGGRSNNIVAQSFTVTVLPNQPPTLDPIGDVTMNYNGAAQALTLNGISPGSAGEIQKLKITATSDNSKVVPNPRVSYINSETTASMTLEPSANASGTASITVTVDDGAKGNNIVSRTFTVTVLPNHQPTLDPIDNLTMNYSSAPQTVTLTGIGTGAEDEVQKLKITATSDNSKVVPNPRVSYINSETTASMTLKPSANASGTANITVTVDDGAKGNNIVTQTFAVTVLPNQPPTLNPIGDLTLDYSSAALTVDLNGISVGAAGEIQKLKITATSDNSKVVPNPRVSYLYPDTSGSLTLKPAANASGTANITVTVNDGGKSDNIFTQTFAVTVLPNQPPTLDPVGDLVLAYNSAAQTVNLGGIGAGAAGEIQKLKITATSDNSKLVPNPRVSYLYPETTASMSIKPSANASGTANITITVNDGAKDNNVISRTFAVTVLPDLTSADQQKSAVDLSAVAATLSSALDASGQFTLTVNGVSGFQYVVEASSDFSNWAPVQTNTAPFVFVDDQTGQFNKRFYRAVYVP